MNGLQIHSCFISRGTVTLAEFITAPEKFLPLSRQLLENVHPSHGRNSYMYEGYLIHCVVDEEVECWCIADEVAGRVVYFSFMEQLLQRFHNTYGKDEIRSAVFLEYNQDFSRVIQKQLESATLGRDKVGKLKRDLAETTAIMSQNLSGILDRGVNIDTLVDKSSLLGNEATAFHRSTIQVQRSFWWTKIKYRVLLVLVLLSVVLVAFFAACSGVSCLTKSPRKP
jgi:hypothetical protein